MNFDERQTAIVMAAQKYYEETEEPNCDDAE
jgi:hypothetical protein